MIPATTPITEPTFDGWTIAHFGGERRGPGVCSISFVAVPCYEIDPATGATQILRDPTRRVEVGLADANASAKTYGEWWTDELRLRVMLWMAEGEALAGIIGAARGVL